MIIYYIVYIESNFYIKSGQASNAGLLDYFTSLAHCLYITISITYT